jgi:hypothetical protein
LQEIAQLLERAVQFHADVARRNADGLGDFLIAQTQEKS